ncbi:MAG: DUF4956 domain-containing protein [Saprospiraceae bacterium]|nr:DUF4956 domain-containing protein [Saprospiraceae bacterium]
MLRFEEYLQEFNASVDLRDFLINLVVAAVLALLLRVFYVRYGTSVTNRRKFSMNFIPLALTTFVIITVIKSSLALSLGLVGALSIVRFRAAIKDPEELTYLFLTIAIGLVTGANKPILAIVAVICILPIIFFNQSIRNRMPVADDRMYINIRTDITDVKSIVSIIEKHFQYLSLKRMDQREGRLNLTFVCKANDLASLDDARENLMALSEQTSVSFIDKPDLAT